MQTFGFSVSLSILSISIHRILNSALRHHPYRIQTVWDWSKSDFAWTDAFCEWFVASVNEHSDVIHSLIMSDEVTFDLFTCVNELNYTISNREFLKKSMPYLPSWHYAFWNVLWTAYILIDETSQVLFIKTNICATYLNNSNFFLFTLFLFMARLP